MKILKKVFISLFSLALFCGLSVTAFAASPRVHATAYVKDDNTSIAAEMRSKDGEEHDCRANVRYYDKRGELIDEYKDKRPYMTKEVTMEWYAVRDWDSVEVRLYCDGKLVYNRELRRVEYDKDGIYAVCFVGEGNQIIARMNFKDGKKHDYRVKLTCYDWENNVIETDTQKDTTYGEAEVGWSALPAWDTADLTFFLDGRRINLGLTR